ncbi:DUF1800 family protein, partial [bacterium]|nr:DUF1800 family protein [bacterium]
VFNDNGKGARGDLKAVVTAILLHPEARNRPEGPVPGKLREPVLRFTAWARAFSAFSPDYRWDIPATDDPALGLGQSPLRSPTVFNFFRPGYVPPNTAFSRPSPSHSSSVKP